MARRLKLTILGAGGTIGKILSQDLADRHDVYPATRSMCDLRNRNALYEFLKSRTDHVIVNCAMAGGKQTLGAYDSTDLYDNMLAFHNLASMQDKYRTLINIGSGAEFDVSIPISMAKEDALTTVLPRDSYGMAKNLIARTCLLQNNAINLRLFGCFDPREPDFRLLRRFVNTFRSGRQFILEHDRLMSWISGADLAKVVELMADHWPGIPNDINCAYQEPLWCSDLLGLWCQQHGVAPAIVVDRKSDHQYTCDSRLLHHEIGYMSLGGPEIALRRYT